MRLAERKAKKLASKNKDVRSRKNISRILIMPYFSSISKLMFRKFFGKIRIAFEDNVIPNLIDSGNLSNRQSRMFQKSQGNAIVHRFLPDIWFHSQRKDWQNTINIWSPQRTCYCYNDALWKYKSNGLLTRWWHQLLWHWKFAKRYISTTYVYYLPRRCTVNVNRSNERK